MSTQFSEVYSYVVLGDGTVGRDRIASQLKLLGKTKLPIPHFQFAKTLEQAGEIAQGMRADNRMLLICKIVEVVQWVPPS